MLKLSIPLPREQKDRERAGHPVLHLCQDGNYQTKDHCWLHSSGYCYKTQWIKSRPKLKASKQLTRKSHSMLSKAFWKSTKIKSWNIFLNSKIHNVEYESHRLTNITIFHLTPDLTLLTLWRCHAQERRALQGWRMTRFLQSLSWVRKNQTSEINALLAGCFSRWTIDNNSQHRGSGNLLAVR